MAVITIATTKGGAGKTTIARLLLGHAVQHGRKVAGLDADLNHSLADWAAHESKVPIPVQAVVDETQIVATISALSAAHDFVVVDTPGAAGQATLFAIGCADLVLVPSRLSSSDVTEAVKTMKLVESAAAMMGRRIPARVVLTNYKPHVRLAAHVEQQFKAAKLPELATRLHSLISFEEMSFDGRVPMTGSAGEQTAELYDEVMGLLPKSQKSRKVA